ncbi:hypothetical protein N7457_006354 [Penicillium paradoxum]|uniref:uncharacterized protein n=1 Tax=Penicillium paradoxum TaxID=176176 RepID=UPI002548D17F|nr:uncharacterized protein N7457_006354 [Penicillium paradoxum]KAJ5781194.1 hypothetical protein N7457_006354 [Penicillium paradoxum]
MSHTIKNVAIAGASGNVGSRVLDALLDLKFNVTVLSRSAKPFPAGARVKVVDFTSVKALTAAVAGHDAVIDATSSLEFETPLRLIDAAAKAGVYRFITSDFGLDPEIPAIHNMPCFERKKVSYEAVKKEAANNRLTYTLIACGGFFDWALSSGFLGFNFQEKSAFICGDGNNVVPWTTLADVGKATANVLLHPQETLNRPVYVHSVYITQNQLFDIAKEILGYDGWSATYNDMEPHLQKAFEDIKTGNVTYSTITTQIQYCMAVKELTHPWKQDDNSLAGLEEWSVEKVKELIRTTAAEAV